MYFFGIKVPNFCQLVLKPQVLITGCLLYYEDWASGIMASHKGVSEASLFCLVTQRPASVGWRDKTR